MQASPIELLFKWQNEKDITKFTVLPNEPVSSIKTRLSPLLLPEVTSFTLTCKGVLLQDTFTLLGLPSGSIVYVIPAITPIQPAKLTNSTRRHNVQTGVQESPSPSSASLVQCAIVSSDTGIVGEVTHFKLVFGKSDIPLESLRITVEVNGPERIQTTMTRTAERELTVSYVTKLRGVYEVKICINEENIAGSPFTVTFENNNSNSPIRPKTTNRFSSHMPPSNARPGSDLSLSGGSTGSNSSIPLYLQTAPGKINTGLMASSKSAGNISVTVEPEIDLATSLSAPTTRHAVLKRNTTTGTPILNNSSNNSGDQLSLKLPTNNPTNRNSERKTRKKSLSLTGEDQKRYVLPTAYDSSAWMHSPALPKQHYQPSDLYYIVKIQSFIRGFNETSTTKNKSLKRKVIDEIVQSEYGYCKNLQILQAEFKIPLTEMAKQSSYFTEKDLHVLFSNLDEIVIANSTLYLQLCPLMGSHDARVVAEIFRKEAPTLKKTYQCYIENFNEALKIFDTLKKCPDIEALLQAKEKHETYGFLTLPPLLITPIQRLPKYELLFRELLKFSDPEETNAVSNALDAMKDTVNHLNDKKKEHDNVSVILNLKNKIDGAPAELFQTPLPLFIIETACRLRVSVEKKVKNVHAILLSTALIIAKKSSKKSNEKFIFSVDLKGAVVDYVQDGIKVIVDQLMFTLYFEKTLDQENWFRHLSSYCQKFRS